jgi:hypothetical protein
MEIIEMNASQLDDSIRKDYNACQGLGMTRYNTLRQLASVYVTTCDFIRESLERSQWA